MPERIPHPRRRILRGSAIASALAIAAVASPAMACRLSDFSNMQLSQLSEVERLSYVMNMRMSEFNKLKALNPGDPNFYALISASPSLRQAKIKAKELLDATVPNGAEYAKVWATNHLDDKSLQAYNQCISKEDTGVWIRARQTAPGVFTMAFAHSRPIGVWPLPTTLVASENIKNVKALEKHLKTMGPLDEVNSTFSLVLADPKKPAKVTLKFGEETPRSLLIPVFPMPQATLPAAIADSLKPGTTFKDCADGCPEMVSVPAGSFMMGASLEEDLENKMTPSSAGKAAPVHKVDIGPGLAISKYPVTVAQYAAFVKETGYKATDHCHTARWVGKTWVYEDVAGVDWRNPDPEIKNQDNFPVACVTWEDAKAYTEWLSRKTGLNYRLPTEAEFEYSARAGTTTQYYWGDDKDRTQGCAYSNQPDLAYARRWDGDKVLGAHYRWQCDDGYAWSSPVGIYKPNAFGLFDTFGNVWQWTEDCWTPGYVGAPTDGSARTDGDCDLHMMRGGSSGNAAWAARAGNRNLVPYDYAGHSFGFRVARK